MMASTRIGARSRSPLRRCSSLIALIMLLSATWLGLSFANRLVAPIRRLIAATDQVSSGNLNVQVATRKSEGDLAHLGETFNKMTSELRLQQNRLVAASQLIDERRAVHRGGALRRSGRRGRRRPQGRNHRLNPSAERLIPPAGEGATAIVGKPVEVVLPEIADAFAEARAGQTRMAPTRDFADPRRPRAAVQRQHHQRADGPRRQELYRHARRHHRSRQRAAHRRLGRRRAPHRA